MSGTWVQSGRQPQQQPKKKTATRDEAAAAQAEAAVAQGWAAAQAVAAEVAADAAAAQRPGPPAPEAAVLRHLADQEARIAAEFERITAKRKQEEDARAWRSSVGGVGRREGGLWTSGRILVKGSSSSCYC